MSKFGWNPETGGAGASMLDKLSDRRVKKDRLSLSATLRRVSRAERRRQCYVQRSFPTISISRSFIINAITLYSIRKLDLPVPALECLVNDTIPGSQLLFTNFLDELSLSGATVPKESFGIEQTEL